MKKILISIGLCILITLSLTGCNLFGSSKDNTTTQKSSLDTNQKQSTNDNSTNSQNDEKQSKSSNSQTMDSNSNDQSSVKQNTQKTQNQAVGKVTFCENVDSNLNAINSSTRFTTGRIYARLQASQPLNATSIKITLFYVDGGSESVIDSIVQDCDPSWSIYAFPVTTTSPGKYKVIITDGDTNRKLGEGTFTAEDI